MNIREYLKTRKILADGAMGTYYAQREKNDGAVSEYANIEKADAIEEIHSEYIESGANLIITNTFAANHASLNLEQEKVEKCIRNGIKIAKKAVETRKNKEQDVFIAGDVGPIPEKGEQTEEEILAEYKRICDIYIEEQLSVILFETFSSLYYIKKLVSYIREKDKEVFIITNLCSNKNGYTQAGMSIRRLLEELAEIDEIDAFGLNCGIGSGHMYQIVQDMQDLFTKKYFMAVPNAGYPEQFQNRMVFLDNAEYFAENMKEIAGLGAAILGGCCGTTPEYISLLREKIDFSPVVLEERKLETEQGETQIEKRTKKKNQFYEKFSSGKKVVAVEIDPPYDANYEKVMECALHLKKSGVDIITIADSPMGRSRVDSILMSVKIANETGMPVMPHVCCRDKNMIAMRSGILGAYIHKIRNLLIVTGDPVPSVSRNVTTGVFDYHSIRLMHFVKEMNEEHFADDPIYYGGALNYGRGKLDKVIARMQEKIDAGASYFLTQPIYAQQDIDRICQMKERLDTKILCGIMPLVSYRNANFIKNEMTGIYVPDEIVNRYSPDMTKEEAEWTGAEIANEIIEKLSSFADGYYFMLPFNRVSLMDKIVIK